MISTTHSVLALAALSKADDKSRNWAIFTGSALPDLVIYIWAPYQILIRKVDSQTLWNDLYFQAPMQNLIAYFNSVPIYATFAVLGFTQRRKIWGALMLVFALAALLHIATDLPVHNHDAYRHFWPLSDWRFISPLSYYEADHHGRWVSFVEAIIAAMSIFILWRRFPKLSTRIILALLAIFYIFIQISSLLA